METRKNAPTTRGRPFAAGNSGRPLGARHKTTLAIEALLEGQHAALTQKAILVALEGDVSALKMCLDRLAPPRRDAPVKIDLPHVAGPADTLAASSIVISAVSGGAVSPSEGATLMALLSAHQRFVETLELETRLEQLEKRAKEGGR